MRENEDSQNLWAWIVKISNVLQIWVLIQNHGQILSCLINNNWKCPLYLAYRCRLWRNFPPADYKDFIGHVNHTAYFNLNFAMKIATQAHLKNLPLATFLWNDIMLFHARFAILLFSFIQKRWTWAWQCFITLVDVRTREAVWKWNICWV